MAQHPAAVTTNNNEKFRSLKSKENIQKKGVGPYHGFGYQSLISDPINLAKGARGNYCIFENLNMAVVMFKQKCSVYLNLWYPK